MSDRVRVLYAEDNRHDADLTRSYFERNAPDLELEVVATGAGCLARLTTATFDILLLDYRLSDQDGADLLDRIVERELRLPVVMVTGVGDEALVVQLLRRGAWDYVPKQGGYLDRLPALLRKAVREVQEPSRWTAVGPSVTAPGALRRGQLRGRRPDQAAHDGVGSPPDPGHCAVGE